MINDIVPDYEHGLGIVELASKHHRCKLTIKKILRENNIPIRTKEIQNSLSKMNLSKWRSVDGLFEPIKTESLFYLMGILSGDGFLSKYTGEGCTQYKIGLAVNDKSFITSFISAMRDIGVNHNGCIFIDIHKNKNWKNTYKTVSYCKVFYEWYERTTLDWVSVNADIPEYKFAFVKGMYESEGSLLDNNGYNCIEIINTSEEVLKIIKTFLESVGLHPTLRIAKRKNTTGREHHLPVYKVGLYRDSEVRFLLERIQPCIGRKAL
jgi:intein-encoded DNA endonuclease-like protein